MPDRLKAKAISAETAPTKRISQNEFSHQMARFWTQVKTLRNLSMALHQTGVRAVLEYDQLTPNRSQGEKLSYSFEWDLESLSNFDSEIPDLQIRHWDNISRQAVLIQNSLSQVLQRVMGDPDGPTYAALSQATISLEETVASAILLCDVTSALGKNSNFEAAREIFDIRNALRESYQGLQESNLVVAHFAQQNPEFRFKDYDRKRLLEHIVNLEKEMAEIRRVDAKIKIKEDQLTARELAVSIGISVTAINKRIKSLTERGWLDDMNVGERDVYEPTKGRRRYFDPKEAEIIQKNPRGPKRTLRRSH